MKTLENNKLLAEFLEFKKVEYDNNYHAFLIPDYLAYHEYKNLTLENNNEVVAWDAENLLFNKNWNWLMNVVDKIESLDNNFYFEIYKDEVSIFRNSDLIINNSGAPKMKLIYNSCVEFVKWYNNNK